MHTRRLLASSGILAALAALGACGRTTSPPPAGAAPPTAEEARAYVEAAERELGGASEEQARIAWIYATYITYDSEWLAAAVQCRGH